MDEDIRSSLLLDPNRVNELVERHGREAVVDEIEKMTGDLAHDALWAAIALKDPLLVKKAAAAVLNSGAYPEGAKKLAELRKNG